MRELKKCAVIAALSICASLAHAADLKALRGIGSDLAEPASPSDADIVEGSRNMMAQMAEQNGVAPTGSDHAQRLA